jgi:hypothetical protein
MSIGLWTKKAARSGWYCSGQLIGLAGRGSAARALAGEPACGTEEHPASKESHKLETKGLKLEAIG